MRKVCSDANFNFTYCFVCATICLFRRMTYLLISYDGNLFLFFILLMVCCPSFYAAHYWQRSARIKCFLRYDVRRFVSLRTTNGYRCSLYLFRRSTAHYLLEQANIYKYKTRYTFSPSISINFSCQRAAKTVAFCLTIVLTFSYCVSTTQRINDE
jgi:hypothetical protein